MYWRLGPAREANLSSLALQARRQQLARDRPDLVAAASSSSSSSSPDPPIVFVEPSPCGTLLAVVSQACLVLWSTKPLRQLSAETVESAHYIVGLVWSPDSRYISVAYADIEPTMYRVSEKEASGRGTAPYDMHFGGVNEHYALGTNEGNSATPWMLLTRLLDVSGSRREPVETLDFEIVSAASGPSGVVCFTAPVNDAGDTHPNAICYQWPISNVPFSSTRIALAGEPFTRPVRTAVYSSTWQVWAWTSSEGSTLHVSRALSSDQQPSSVSSPISASVNVSPDVAVSISVCDSQALVAIGTLSGHVLFYTIRCTSADSTITLESSHSISCSSAAIPIQHLAWTRDGYALAICRTDGRVQVWSSYGWTLAEFTMNDFSNSQTEDESAPLSSSSFGYIGERGSRSSVISVDSMTSIDFSKRLYIHDDSATDDGDKILDALPPALAGLLWSIDGLELYAVPSYTAAPVDNSRMAIFPFAKSLATLAPSNKESHRHVALLSSTMLMLYTAGFELVTSSRSRQQSWHYAQIPASYLADNWPISYAAISPDGATVALAGTYGLCVYSARDTRWRTIQSSQLESRYTIVGGMDWLPISGHLPAASGTLDASNASYSALVFACIDNTTDTPELHVISKGTLLDSIGSAGSVAMLPAPAHCISLSGDSIVVMCVNNTAYEYAVATASPSDIELIPRRRLDLTPLGMFTQAIQIRSIHWAPKVLHDDQSADGGKTALFLLAGGSLAYIGLDTHGTADTRSSRVLRSQVEFFACEDLRLGSVVALMLMCVRGSLEVQPISIDDVFSAIGGSSTANNTTGSSDNQDDAELLRHSKLAFLPDCYPTAFSVSRGLAVGIEQETRQSGRARGRGSSAGNRASAVLEINSQPFIPDVVLYLLALDQPHNALMYLSQYEHLSYFNHLLELILHRSLEHDLGLVTSNASVDENKAPSSRSVILSRVIDLLDNFPGYLDVVVHCSRKTDMAIWDRLGQAVGGIQSFFDRCLNAGKLHTAAQYLLVLQALQSVETCARNSLRLLELVVAERDAELCKKLVKFLENVAHSDEALGTLLADYGIGIDSN
ncbi:hypothetical protein GQ42DRAFT_161902 [Ramicandelaber brevisporus]|nr:hypothetical protein GQ42DRAFT_161902 [Ramicandelaber brevisporus]